MGWELAKLSDGGVLREMAATTTTLPYVTCLSRCPRPDFGCSGLRRVRSAAPMWLLRVVLVLSPESRRFMSPRITNLGSGLSSIDHDTSAPRNPG